MGPIRERRNILLLFLNPRFRLITLCITCDLSLKRHPESAA
ncbi:MAG: hypothetical protein QOI88_879 [Gammaproteobacteria bacterium]|jgi:hypothetical protein|nr:hypothetical protein [Gammaproteobacteria bacterium]